MISACITRDRREPSVPTYNREWNMDGVHHQECRWVTWCVMTWKRPRHHRCRRKLLLPCPCPCPCHPHPHLLQPIQIVRQKIWISCLAWRPPTSTSTAGSSSPSHSPASSWCTGSSTATWATTLSTIWSIWFRNKNLTEIFLEKV